MRTYFSLMAALCVGCATAQRSPRDVRSNISAARLETRLSIIANDSTEGRAAGSPGALRAQRYVERELRRLGLTPGGEDGTFLQAPLIIVRRIGDANLRPDGGAPFRLWEEFAPIPWAWRSPGFDSTRAVFGGELGGTMITAEQAAGRFVVLRQPAGRSVFPRVSPNDVLRTAAAVAVVGLEKFGDARLSRVRKGLEAGLQGDPMQSSRAPLSLLLSTTAAEQLFGGRRLSALQIGDSGRMVRGSAIVADSATRLCCNVIGILRGTSPQYRSQYVALGAHLDHLGVNALPQDHDSTHAAAMALWAFRGNSAAGAAPENAQQAIAIDVRAMRRYRPPRADSIFNGADDDGSGTVALLELAEFFSDPMHRPARSVLFAWHTGEELGNLGSTWFTEHPSVERDSIIAQLNLDMIGRGSVLDVVGGGLTYLQVIGSRRLSHELGALIERVNARRTTPFRLDYQYDSLDDPRHYYCRSDHYEYARFGIPIAFFTTGEHADYHRVTDEVQYIDFDHMASITAFMADVVAELGAAKPRPRLDGPKPDARAGCAG
jgi:hypothetical protein